MFTYEGEDEPVMQAKQHFKVSFFNQMLDCTTQSVEESFSQLQAPRKTFGVLYNIPSVKDRDASTVLNKCTALEQALTHWTHIDGKLWRTTCFEQA